MEMNQQNQVSNSLISPDVTVKRKRGRPRRDPAKPKTVYVPKKRALTQNHGEAAPVPPGFEEANGNQHQPVDSASNNTMDSMVGQVVTGVIEAVFDAGFLLSVRVGNSNTSLRGVVFKSGQYVPVCPENDIAPGVQMIKRNEVPLPAGREHCQQHTDIRSNGSSTSNKVARVRSRQLAIVPAEAPTPDPLEGRGTLVPVLLQPVSLSNGATPAIEAPRIACQPAHLAASKVKLKHTSPIQAVPVVSGSASNPFDELVSVAKKMEGVPCAAETQNDGVKASVKMLGNDPGLTQEDEDLSKPLFVEPLQSIHSGLPAQSLPMSHTFPERRTGKMTELLMAVQENLMERHVSDNRHLSDNRHHEFRNPEN